MHVGLSFDTIIHFVFNEIGNLELQTCRRFVDASLSDFYARRSEPFIYQFYEESLNKNLYRNATLVVRPFEASELHLLLFKITYIF